MAISTFTAIDPNTDTFSAWVLKTNDMIEIFRGAPGGHAAVTALDGGWANTDGNAKINGGVQANLMIVVEELRGGTNTASNWLYVSSNVEIQSTAAWLFVNSTAGINVTADAIVHESVDFSNTTGTATLHGDTRVEQYLSVGSEATGNTRGAEHGGTVDTLQVTGSNVELRTYTSNTSALIRTSTDGSLTISSDIGANSAGQSYTRFEVDNLTRVEMDTGNVDFYEATGVAVKARWAGAHDTNEGSLSIRKLTSQANAALDVDGEARVDSLIVDGSVTSNVYVGNTNWTDGAAGHAHWVNIRKSDASVSGIGWQTTLADTTTFLDTVVKTTGDESLVLSVDDTARGITTADIDLQSNGVRRMSVYANGDVSWTEETGADRLIWDGARGTEGYLRHLDNVRSTFGDGDDFNIFHNGTHSYIVDTGTGNTYLQTDTNFLVTNQAGTANSIVANTVGEVSLYHNNDRKLQTNAYGVEITGEANTDTLRVNGDAHFDGSTDGISPSLDANNIEWISLSNTMNFDDNTYLEFGTSGDFKIHHDGSHTYMQDTAGVGNVYLDTNTFIVRNAAGNENMIRALQDTSVALYYNNGIKVETTDIGIEVTGEANTGTLNVRGDARFESDALSADEEALTWTASTRTMNWHDNAKATFGTDGTDLQIYHDGSASWIQEAGAGNLIIEGTDMTLRATDDSRYLRGVDGTVTTARTELYSPGDDAIALTANSDQVHITNLANTNTLRVRSTSLFENNISIEGSDNTEGVSWTKSSNTMNFNDNNFLTFGTTADLSIYHDVNNSVIRDSGTGDLILEATNLNLRATDGTRYALFTDGAGLQFFSPTSNTEEVVINDDGLFVTNEANTDTLTVRNTSLFQNDMSIEGSTSAVTVTWDKTANTLNLLDNNYITFGSLDDLRLYHTGTTSHIENQVGELVIDQTANDSDIVIRSDDGAGGITDYVRVDGSSGEVLLNFYGSTKLATKTGGIVVTGNTVADGFVAGDNEKVQLGDIQDLELYHNATNSLMTNKTGNLIIRNNADDADVLIQSDDSLGGTANYIQADGSTGEVILSHYGAAKLTTKINGVQVTGLTDTDSLLVSGLAEFEGDINIQGSTGSDTLTWDKSANTLSLLDNNFITFGNLAGGDMQIYHDGADSYIKDVGQGALRICSNDVLFKDEANTETMARFLSDGAITLYHNNSIKMVTQVGGITVTGNTVADGFVAGDNEKLQLGAGQDLELYHTGTTSFIDNNTGDLVIQSEEAAKDVVIKTDDGSGGLANYVLADGSTGEVVLSHLGSTKLQTKSTGVQVTGRVDADGFRAGDDELIQLGDAQEFQIVHTAAGDTTLTETGAGSLILQGNNIILESTAGENYLQGAADGSVELYHNGASKLATSATGATLTGTLVADGVTVGDNEIIQLGTTMQLYNNGTASYINETGTDSLFVQSNNLVLESTAGEAYLFGQSDSSVTIYYNGLAKLNTASGGVQVTGETDTDTLLVSGTSSLRDDIGIWGSTGAATVTWDKSANTLNFDDNNFATFGTDADLSIYHNSTASYIDEQGTGSLNIRATNLVLRDSGDTEAAAFISGGEGRINHAGATKIQTTATGATITGTLVADGVTVGDSEIVQLGTTMQLYNDGTDSYVKETGTGSLFVQANNLVLESTTGENYFLGTADGASQIYYNGVSKLQTLNTGVNVTGNVVSDGLNVDGGSYVSGSTRLGSAVAPTATLDVTGNAKISTTLEVTSNISTNGNVLPLTEFNDLGSLTARWDAFLGDVQIGDTKNILPEVTATSAATGSDVGSDALRFNIYGHIGDFTGAMQVDGNITTGGDVTLTAGGLTVFNDSEFQSNVVFDNIQVNNIANIQLLELQEIVANNVAIIGNGATVEVTGATTIDSIPLTQSRGLKYMIQGQNDAASSAFMIEIMVSHNGTDAFFTRYAEVSNSFDCTLTPSISGGNLILQATCPSASVSNSHVFNISRNELRVV